MDKYEYKVRAEEIKQLIAKGDYEQAAEIADTIDWRRVKSVMMLCTISDIYKINRRYEDAKDMLLLAYDRRPDGRNICYSLCELCLKTGELVQATEYYKKFVRIAPTDPGRYILQYKIFEDQEVSLEERIGVLEELKRHDYREKWAYELAYLYHRVGLATRCVEECDEMILWFGEGQYVTKAMELKMLHQPLTPEQQEKYEHRFELQEEEPVAETDEQEEAVSGDTITYEPVRSGVSADEVLSEDAEGQEPEATQNDASVRADTGEFNIHVKTVDVGQYNTLNLQAELAEQLKELLDEEEVDGDVVTPEMVESYADHAEEFEDELPEYDEEDYPEDEEEYPEEDAEEFYGEYPAEYQDEAEALAEEPEEYSGEYEEEPAEYDEGEYPDEDAEEFYGEPEEEAEELDAEPAESSEVFFGETGEIGNVVLRQMRQEADGQQSFLAKEVQTAQPPEDMAKVLSQEADGQIRIVLPEKEPAVEKQITGQMSIEDVLAEWEQMKKRNEEKRREDVRKHVLQHTGDILAEFEAAVKDGLLEQLEKAPVDEPEKKEQKASAAISHVVEAQNPDSAAEDVLNPETQENDEPDEVEELAEIEETPAEEVGQDETEEAFETETDEEYSEADGDDEENLAGNQEDISSEDTASGDEAFEESSEADEEEYLEPEEDIAADAGEPFVQTQDGEPADELEESSGTKTRAMTREEKELYGPYLQSKSTKDQIVRAVDTISLAAYTGNVIITGGADMDTIPLAKSIIREIQSVDSNFSGKVAKISGKGLNRKDMDNVLKQLQNGALIIQTASGMNPDTAQRLYKALQNESLGIVVILQDDTESMEALLAESEILRDAFNARIDVEALSNDMLVAYGKQYAKEKEYSIDALGVLALHNRIEKRQTLEHSVTTDEVREIVDEAIRHANKKTLGHFANILLAKRYDEEDMIIITEKDFM